MFRYYRVVTPRWGLVSSIENGWVKYLPNSHGDYAIKTPGLLVNDEAGLVGVCVGGGGGFNSHSSHKMQVKTHVFAYH